MGNELDAVGDGSLIIRPVDQRVADARRVFNPHQPIADRNLFSGRIAQLDQALTAIRTPGKHPIVFGVRGVGKTSLANIIKIIAPIDGLVVTATQCSTTSTFQSIVSACLEKVTYGKEKAGLGFDAQNSVEKVSLKAHLPETFTQENVVDLVRDSGARILMVVDEFDRVRPQERAKMSDFVKAASDNGSDKLKLLIVGVGETLDDLIRDHPSVERNISEVHMTLMSSSEIRELLTKGAAELQIALAPVVVDRIIDCAQGFPYFAHLLAQHSSISAIRRNSTSVTEDDFTVGLAASISEVDQSIRRSYAVATQSNQPNQLEDVLYAAACAATDEFGYFRATALTEVPAKRDGSRFTLQGIQYPLSKLTTLERGQVLLKEGSERRFRYRFANPMMKQYVIMRRMAEATPA